MALWSQQADVRVFWVESYEAVCIYPSTRQRQVRGKEAYAAGGMPWQLALRRGPVYGSACLSGRLSICLSLWREGERQQEERDSTTRRRRPSNAMHPMSKWSEREGERERGSEGGDRQTDRQTASVSFTFQLRLHPYYEMWKTKLLIETMLKHQSMGETVPHFNLWQNLNERKCILQI